MVGSLIAGERALLAMSTRMRNANRGSWSRVRSGPTATHPRSASAGDRSGSAEDPEQRVAGGDGIADLRDQLDDRVRVPGEPDQVRRAERHDHPGPPRELDHLRGEAGSAPPMACSGRFGSYAAG